MKDYIVTFGYGHSPGIGFFCRIPAENEMEAREIMNGRTSRWAFMYDSEEKAGVDEWRLREAIWDEGERIWRSEEGEIFRSDR